MSIRNIVTVGILTGLAGCVTPENIKPQDMSKFNSPAEVIMAKNLNGKEGLGKEYLITNHTKDAFLPHAYMEKLCLSQSGQFNQIAKSTLSELKKDENKVVGFQGVADHIGTFKCSAGHYWYVSIEPQFTRFNELQSLAFITVKTRVIDNAIVSANALESARIKQQNDEIQKREAKAQSIEWRKNFEKGQKEVEEMVRKNLESAENQVKLRTMYNGDKVRAAFSRFDDLERRVDEAQGYADALAIGAETPRTLGDEIDALNSIDEVDAELAAMKKAMKKGG